MCYASISACCVDTRSEFAFDTVGIIGCGFVVGILNAWLKENNNCAKIFVRNQPKKCHMRVNLYGSTWPFYANGTPQG